MILVIDIYDCFTYNVLQYLNELGGRRAVFRNDAITVTEALAAGPEADGAIARPLHAQRSGNLPGSDPRGAG